MSNTQNGTSRSPSFLGMPRTRLGGWSIGLAVLFLGLCVAWLLYVQATPLARPTFFSDPLHACLLLGAAAAGITGAIVGVLALVAKRERSILILLSVLLGAFVLMATGALVSRLLFKQQPIWRAIVRVVFLILLTLLLLHNGIVPYEPLHSTGPPFHDVIVGTLKIAWWFGRLGSWSP